MRAGFGRPKLLDMGRYDSVERASLAEAIADRQVARDAHTKLLTAAERLAEQHEAATDAAESARADVAKSKGEAAAYALAAAIGDEGEAPVSPLGTKVALQEALDVLDALSAAQRELQSRMAVAAADVQSADQRVKAAATTALLTSPAVAKVKDDVIRLQRELIDAASAFTWLLGHHPWPVIETPGGMYGQPADRAIWRAEMNLEMPPKNWNSLISSHPDPNHQEIVYLRESRGAQRWKAALAALQEDANAALPE